MFTSFQCSSLVSFNRDHNLYLKAGHAESGSYHKSEKKSLRDLKYPGNRRITTEYMTSVSPMVAAAL